MNIQIRWLKQLGKKEIRLAIEPIAIDGAEEDEAEIVIENKQFQVLIKLHELGKAITLDFDLTRMDIITLYEEVLEEHKKIQQAFHD